MPARDRLTNIRTAERYDVTRGTVGVHDIRDQAGAVARNHCCAEFGLSLA